MCVVDNASQSTDWGLKYHFSDLAIVPAINSLSVYLYLWLLGVSSLKLNALFYFQIPLPDSSAANVRLVHQNTERSEPPKRSDISVRSYTRWRIVLDRRLYPGKVFCRIVLVWNTCIAVTASRLRHSRTGYTVRILWSILKIETTYVGISSISYRKKGLKVSTRDIPLLA